VNPRHRRLLIPGLLLALIAVVIVASLVDRSDAATSGPAVTLSDPRITESSGLALSSDHADLAYPVNDSGHAAQVFAVDLSSQVEALAVRDGTLWIGDVGDSDAERDDAALYAIDEPGRDDGTAEAKRYPVALAGGPPTSRCSSRPPGRTACTS
jgi:hypothetical protein